MLTLTESDVCRRQILTYIDDPRNERIKIFLIAIDTYNIRIQIIQTDLTKTFMMLLNYIKPFDPHGLYKNNSTL